MDQCTSCGSTNPAGFRFCGTCGASLALPATGHGKRKTVTVVFIDIAGSTELGERLDAEMVRRLMSRFYATSRAIIERHGGTVEKFIGDAVMAVFGIPNVHEDDAIRAVRAAHEIRLALADLGDGLASQHGVRIEARIGIDTGEVVAGDTQAGEGFATGEAVNLAQRLEAAAAPGDILIGETTLAGVQHIVRSQATDPILLKGRSAPIRAHRIIEVETAPAERPLRGNTSMVGRSEELTALNSALSEARATGTTRLITILGMAGVGKSRLVREFTAATAAGGATVLRGRCLAYGEGVTYWPLAELVRGAAGIELEDPPELGLAKLESLVADEPERDEVVARIAAAIGLSSANPPPDDVFWAVRRLLQRQAQHRPLVVVFEDIHWAEQTFLDLIEHLARWIEDAPVLIVCLARPELSERRPDWSAALVRATKIELEPLDANEATLLAGQLLEGGAETGLLELVVGTAEGNPLFTEEVVAMLMEGDRLRQTDGIWRVVDDVETLEIPGTIQTLLAARLDQLPREERDVAERASVIGRIFERAAVAELSPELERPQVGTRLRSLSRRNLIGPFEREDVYRFRHVLIRDAAYEALPKEERARLHERLADWLEQRRDGFAVETEELIGHHLEQAHRYRVEVARVDETTESLAWRAGEWLAAAGTRAAERQDLSAASTLLTRALRLLPRGTPLYWTATATMGVVTAESGWVREGMALLDQALGELEGRDDLTAARIRLQRLKVVLNAEKTPLTNARSQLLSIFCSLTSGAQADKLRAGICERLGWAYREAVLITRAERAYNWGLHYAERSGDPVTKVDCLTGLIDLGLRTTTPVSELDARCRAVLEMPGLPRARRADIAEGVAYIRALAGRFEEAREWSTKASHDRKELGVDTMDARIPAGLIELMADRPERAERHFRALYDWRNSEGDELAPILKRFVAARLAQALQAQGRLDDAEQMVSEAADAPEGYDPWTDTISRGTMARILAQRGQLPQAVELAERAVADARASGADALTLLYGGALEDLGLVLLAASDTRAARDVLTDALARYEHKEYTVGAARVRSMLDGIRHAAEGRPGPLAETLP